MHVDAPSIAQSQTAPSYSVIRHKLNCILLIDDDADDNVFHEIVIRGMNITHNIQIAKSGLEALIFLRKENQTTPELIFLDINMPKMNGWEFLEAYHKLRLDQKAKVIVGMLTTSISPDDRKRAEQFPEIASFNSKPLTEEMVIGILERYFPERL